MDLSTDELVAFVRNRDRTSDGQPEQPAEIDLALRVLIDRGVSPSLVVALGPEGVALQCGKCGSREIESCRTPRGRDFESRRHECTQCGHAWSDWEFVGEGHK